MVEENIGDAALRPIFTTAARYVVEHTPRIRRRGDAQGRTPPRQPKAALGSFPARKAIYSFRAFYRKDPWQNVATRNHRVIDKNAIALRSRCTSIPGALQPRFSRWQCLTITTYREILYSYLLAVLPEYLP